MAALEDERRDARGFFRRLYEGWLVIAGHFAEIQTLVILFLIYSLIIGPMATQGDVDDLDLVSRKAAAACCQSDLS